VRVYLIEIFEKCKQPAESVFPTFFLSTRILNRQATLICSIYHKICRNTSPPNLFITDKGRHKVQIGTLFYSGEEIRNKNAKEIVFQKL
jgi:hypothetical protein